VSTPPPFRLVLLTPTPRIETAGGEALNLPAGKPLALLAHLHLVGEPVPRDTLATLLWPGSTRERARGSMRHALWTLRKRVSEELFRSDDPVELADELLTSDLVELRAALARGDVKGAAGAWEAAPFSGFPISDAPEWSRWADAIRFDLENRLGSALAEAGGSRLQDEPGGAGVELLERAVQVQPDRLQHHVTLVEALLDLRDFDQAGTALAQARLALDDPSSLATLDRLERRRQALEVGDAPPSDEQTLRLEFVGRTEEFAALLRRWREARAGSPGIGLILGDPGVGKTRLAEELGRVAEAEEGRCVQVKAEDSERPIEWGLLAEVIQRLLRLSGAAGISPGSDGILRSLMPSLSLAEPVSEDTAVRSLAFSIPRANPSAALSDALIDLITAVSEDAPLLLVVDDLHWADTESRTVLARVSTRLDRASALLLFTCRTEVAEARVRKTLALLGDAPNATTFELEPWSFASMDEALRGRMRFTHPAQADAVLQRIHRTSRGNPLFILELLKVFLEEEIVVIDEGGDWVFHTERLPPNLALPGSVRALVDRQLDQLSREAILVAAHMARIGHATSPRVLGLKTGLGTSAVTNGIGELLARRMVRWEARDSLVFVHDELRAAVARRYQLHVGLTAGGGAQWSFFRTAVVASLGILMLGAALYAFSSPDPLGSGPWGGGVIEAEALDGSLHMLRMRSSGRAHLDPTTVSPTSVAGPELPGTLWVETRAAASGEYTLHVVQAGGDPDGAWVGTVPSRPRRTLISPDHRYVGAVLPGTADTLRLLALGGRRMHEAVLPEVLDLDWCGSNGLMILAHGARGVELIRWRPEEGGPAVLPLPTIVPGGALACSPDGRGLLLAGVRDGRAGVFLLDLGQEVVQSLAWPGQGAPLALRWSSRRDRSVPVELRLDAEESLALGMGGQRLVDGVIVFSGGARSREPLAWSVADSTVAVVSQEGRITALAPGRTRVRARWGGWLKADLEVEVTYMVEAAPLLEARVPSRGDQRVPLPSGEAVTVEFAFTVPEGGGAAEICLLESRRGGGACVRAEGKGSGGNPAKAGYLSLGTRSGIPPVRRRLEGPRFSPEVRPDPEGAGMFAPVSGALIVDAEGWVRLYMEGELWLEAPARVERGPEEAWLLRQGSGVAGVDREGAVFRTIRVWEGERRGRGSSPALEPLGG